MTFRWLTGLLAVTVAVASAAAQTTGGVPAGEANLGTVSIPRAVMADGKPLAAGSYQVRLTAQAAQPQVAGQTMERWVEFVRGGEVRGREVVSIVPNAEMKDLFSADESRLSAPRGARVEMLKGNDYLRVWIARGGVNYLIHLPPSAK
ncbi:MAG: hypothetical protein AB1635_06885 [Acidobacteriota bacterium]